MYALNMRVAVNKFHAGKHLIGRQDIPTVFVGYLHHRVVFGFRYDPGQPFCMAFSRKKGYISAFFLRYFLRSYRFKSFLHRYFTPVMKAIKQTTIPTMINTSVNSILLSFLCNQTAERRDITPYSIRYIVHSLHRLKFNFNDLTHLAFIS